MKYSVYAIVIFVFYVSCSVGNTKGKRMADAPFRNAYDYTGCVESIRQKKNEMLNVADGIEYFGFSDDTDLRLQNVHAYWLMNRMMQMAQLIQTAHDDWAWMLAMNECIEKYNETQGLEIDSFDAALEIIERYIERYEFGNQAKINTASYVNMTVMHYRTVYAYYNLIEHITDIDKDERLSTLYYQEFKEWFNLSRAQNELMCLYTFAAARYSALPMELNGSFACWNQKRLTELGLEKMICLHQEWVPFMSDSKSVSIQEFEKILNCFKEKTQNDVVEEMVADWVEKDYEFAHEQVHGRFDFDEITKITECYETSIANWRKIREQITLILPKEKQKSYREITKQIHTRLYHDFLDLKEIRY